MFRLPGVLAFVKQLKESASDTMIYILQTGAGAEDRARGLSQERPRGSCQLHFRISTHSPLTLLSRCAVF